MICSVCNIELPGTKKYDSELNNLSEINPAGGDNLSPAESSGFKGALENVYLGVCSSVPRQWSADSMEHSPMSG